MVNFVITSSGDLAAGFAATPQKFFEALLDRLTVEANSETWHDGTNAPSDDSGPWFKNGTQLFVWKDGDYNPVSVGDSITLQISASTTEPDPTVYQYWLKYSGAVVIGLYYFMGTTLGWVAQNQVLSDGSVTTAKLANGSITTSRIADNSVKNDFIEGPIPTTKWEKGTSHQFLRMNASETQPGWESTQFESPELTLSISEAVAYSHGLSATPFFADGVFVCKEDEHGWAVGDEVPFSICYSDSGQPLIVRNPTRVYVRFFTNILIQPKGDNTLPPITLSKWKLKFYITAS